MSVDRLKRVNELMRREIGDSLFTLIPEEAFDPGAVTVTRVETAPNLREARVYVSIRGTEAQRRETLRLLARHRRDVQARINRDLTLKYTPRLTFLLDLSLERGDHVLDVLKDLAREAEAAPPPPPAQP